MIHMYVKWIMEKQNYNCERMMAIESNKLLFNEPITDLSSWIWHLFTIQKRKEKSSTERETWQNNHYKFQDVIITHISHYIYLF